MRRITADKHTHTFYEPDMVTADTIASGDCICFDTMDGLEGRSRQYAYGDYRPNSQEINPATGPLYVTGAHQGDTLCIEILDIRCDAQGYVSLWMPHIGIDEPEFDYVEVPIRGGVAMLEGVAFQINPMIGTIGVAHPQGGFTRSAGDWGGNLDTPSIIKGSKLFLPVFVDGALLAMGDFHALQGDGELFGQGIETGGQADVRVSVIQEFPICRPLLFTSDGFVQAICSHESIERAIYIALQDMANYLMHWGLTQKKVAILLAAKGAAHICEIVNPQHTICVSLALEDILRMGADLGSL